MVLDGIIFYIASKKVKNTKYYNSVTEILGRYEASFASGTSIENYKAASKVSTGFSSDSMKYVK